MDSIRFDNFFKKLLLLNYILTKIDAWKIEYELNVGMFVWDYDDLITNKLKQIMNANSKSIKY
jgi:hypothetical protein